MTIDFSRTTLERYSVDLRQFIDFRSATLAGGQRAVDAYNSSGLHFTLLPDRGLDIWTAAFKGKPLTWISQGSPHEPHYGAPYLRILNGGLVFTCGLRHVGPPEADMATGEWRDLHGDYSRQRAFDVSASGGWQGERYVAELRGAAAESALFGEQLRLNRTVRMALGEPSLEIQDVVENRGDAPTPLMVLYHYNFGYPTVHEGVRLHTAQARVIARNDRAREGLETWAEYGAATALFEEQVYFHDVKAGVDGMSAAVLADDAFGIMLEWDADTAPYLTQWKNFRQGIYVCGVEPGNCVPEGQNRARESGRLVMLEPGAVSTFFTRLTVLDGGQAVAEAVAHVAELQAHGQPTHGVYAGLE